MTFDANDYIPKPSNWFEERVRYEGAGQAKFEGTDEILRGSTTVEFDTTGDISVKMRVPAKHRRIYVERKDRPEGGIIFFHESRRICSELTVKDADGIFRLGGEINYFPATNESDDEFDVLDFSSIWSEYIVNTQTKPRFWVVPLLNCLAKGTWRHPGLLRHPLRLFIAPDIPGDLTEEEKFVADFNVNSKGIIPFEFNGGLGFIDRLPDFDERERRLLLSEAKWLVTEIMVGETGTRSIEHEDLDSWFPIDFLHLLEIATGLEVGMPWIEFRGDKGNLVKRLHMSHLSPYIYARRPPIHRAIDYDDIAQILSRFAASPLFHDLHLRGAIRQLARCGLFGRNIEETIGFISRGLDQICELYSLKTYRLADGLDPAQKTAVRGILNDAVKKLRQEKGNPLNAQHTIFDRILSRVTNADNQDADFGLAVAKLLKHPDFNFPDVEIIDGHYAAKPRLDGRTWCDAVTFIRNMAAHDNFFDVSAATFNYRDNQKIIDHLYDLLIRVTLKLIKYDGQYFRFPSLVHSHIDWVIQDKTSARDLGYE